tara:strand:- start:584 stop:1639 length:1056 start_codon:yes stop_codon:yes gene_type:complete
MISPNSTSRVGWAFSHPARHHKLAAREILELCRQKGDAGVSDAADESGSEEESGKGRKTSGKNGGKGAAAAKGGAPNPKASAKASAKAPAKASAKASPKASPEETPHFICLLFRPVYEEDAQIDGHVTAEAYELTPQAEELYKKKSIVASRDDLGKMVLEPSQNLTLTVEGKTADAVNAFYFVSRVHDMGREYTSARCLRVSFPASSRVAVRKMHARKWLERQHLAETPFETLVADWNLILFIGSSVLGEGDFEELCDAVGFTTAPQKASTSAAFAAKKAAAAATLRRAEVALCEWCGVEPPPPKAVAGAAAMGGESVWQQLCDLFKSCMAAVESVKTKLMALSVASAAET